MHIATVFLISAFFCSVSFFEFSNGREKVEKRDEALRFARHMLKEINLFATPVSDIVNSFDGKNLRKDEEDIAKSLEILSPGVGADKICRKIMSSSAPEAVMNCERLCGILEDALEKEIEKNKRENGLKVIFPLFLAVVAFIVLI